MSDQTPAPSEKQPTGLAYCRKAVEEASKVPLPSYEERMAQFARSKAQFPPPSMQADEAAP